jgi:hypothetical protein
MFCSINAQAVDNTYCYDQLFDNHRIDQVVIHEQGVFILVNGCWLSSQGMQATAEGILVMEDGEWLPLHEVIKCDNYHVWRCPICGTYNPQGTSRCRNYKNHPK